MQLTLDLGGSDMRPLATDAARCNSSNLSLATRQ